MKKARSSSSHSSLNNVYACGHSANPINFPTDSKTVKIENLPLKSMAMTPERSNPLHSFNLPSRLRWGTQRYLRCKKLGDDAAERDRVSFSQRSEGGIRIEATGEKLMLDFKQRMENQKVVGSAVEAAALVVTDSKVEGESSRPWNLRTRRSPAPGPVGTAVERSSPVKRVKGVDAEEVKIKFRVPLKREEIEEDFLVMGGIKPPRRPKKRPRAVQKELDTLFPGLWLTEVTPERYVVPEAPES